MTTETLKQVKYTDEREPGIEPKKFLVWLIIVASVMLFAGLTSAYIVRRGEGNWESFNLPGLFTFNTVLIVISSLFMQWSYIAAKKDEIGQIKIALSVTLILGIIFVIGQWYAWEQLVHQSVYFVGNPAGTFVYVISGVHLVHVVVGVFYVAIMLYRTFLLHIHKKNLLPLIMCSTYWHFVGILWVYLYFFFLLNR